MNFGLSYESVDAIRGVLKNFPEINAAVIYGSRAKGNYRPNSDIDLTLKGDKLDLTTLLKAENELDDLLLPYKIDLSIFHKIENKGLLEHIERAGLLFYERKEPEYPC